jgi:hypothetical protein
MKVWSKKVGRNKEGKKEKKKIEYKNYLPRRMIAPFLHKLKGVLKNSMQSGALFQEPLRSYV